MTYGRLTGTPKNKSVHQIMTYDVSLLKKDHKKNIVSQCVNIYLFLITEVPIELFL